MTALLYISAILVIIAGASVILRIISGPSDSDRAVAADLLLGICVALFILFGILSQFTSIMNVLLVVSSAGFLSSLALARLILRDEQ